MTAKRPVQEPLFQPCRACQAVDPAKCWYEQDPRRKAFARRPKGCLAGGPHNTLPDGY